MKAADGSLNLLEWEVGIPGKQGVSNYQNFHKNQRANLHLHMTDSMGGRDL